MASILSRARVCALLLLAVQAPFALGQSLEIYAGGGHFVDIPGNTIGLQPGSIAAAPDGYVYANDINGRLMRLNTATGLATALPATPGGIAYNIGYSYTIAVDFAGRPYVYSQGDLKRIEANGTLTTVGQLSYTGPSAFGPDGSLYVVPGDNRVYARRPTGEHVVIAGGEEAGFGGNGGPALDALLNAPQGVAVSQTGDIYVADSGNNLIRRIDAVSGVITTFAGTGSSGFNGNGLHASQTNIDRPQGLAFDSAGNLLIAASSRILRVNAVSGLVSTAASGISPKLVTVDPAGNIYFSAWGANYQKIWKIDATSGAISLAIGYESFYFCGEGIPARQVCLAQPYALDIDLAGDLIFGDSVYSSIRKVSASTGILSTWKTTTEAAIGIEHDAAGNTFVASYGGYQVNRYDAVTGAKTVVAGGRGYGFGGDGGPATSASLAAPNDVAIDAAGNLYISDSGNNRVRKVTAATGIITTFAVGFSSPGTLEFEPSGNLIVSDRTNCRLRRINITTGAVTTIAGTGTCAFQDAPGGMLATATAIGQNPAFAIDPAGNIFLGWRSSQIYRIDAVTGILTRVPAPPGGLVSPEGVRITAANKMEFDAAGRLYISQEQAPIQYIFRVSGLFDTTPPVIEPAISGTAGTGNWYRSNVQVSWVVSDAESNVSSTSGCTDSSATEDTAGVTFTCTATSVGGTATRSVTIRRDTVAPTLTFALAFPEADADGWNQGDVTIGFQTDDALSGVYSTSTGSPIVFTDEGSGLTRQVVVTDQAGNAATFTTPAINIDRSGPEIEVNVAGSAGDNGWYRGNVLVTWTVSDGGSAVASQDGCGSASVSSDTTGITFTCSATSHGGTASRSVTVKRDATPPTVSFGAPSPAPNAGGWNNTSVSLPYTAEDATSGVITSDPDNPIVFDLNGEGMFVQVHAVDAAGNVAVVESPRVNIDRSPPAVQPLVTGPLGSNGWYTGDVSIAWSIDEAPTSILSTVGCDGDVVSADTAGITFSCSVTSTGGTVSSSVTIKRDATPPVLTFGTPSPVPNTNGWNKTNVSIPFTRSDALSGLASTSTTSPLVLNTEGAGVTGQVTVTDNAGNAATFTSVERNVDKTAPVVSIASPANGATYGFYQDVVGDFTCTDISLLSCVGPTADGALVNTRTAGARTFKVTGKDLANFTTAVTNSFTVESSFNWQGFTAPANPPVINRVARSTRVPIRWQLPDGRGGFVTNTGAYKSISTQSWSCGLAPTVPYTETTSAAAGISFDAATQSFVYNWNTGSSATCRTVTIELRDGSTHEVMFRIQ